LVRVYNGRDPETKKRNHLNQDAFNPEGVGVRWIENLKLEARRGTTR
jgi:hypothetical protein